MFKIISIKKPRSAFTLAELSIVLVIIGLLVASVVTGKDIYKASQLKAVITQVREVKMAVESFEGQYEGLPGDLKNATSFWPSASTANGDNNGKIDSDGEYYRAWEHLSLAKMVAGSYSGTGTDAVIGTNIPQSKHLDGGLQLIWVAAPGSYTDNQGGDYSANYILLGTEGVATGGSDYLTGAMFKPEDAFYIDNKLDNDQPDYGAVLADDGDGQSTCLSSGAYNFATSAIVCILYVSLD